MDKKILAVAGIIFALVFIVLLAIMFSSITSKTSDSNDKMVEAFNDTAKINLDAYAKDSYYKGIEVIALIQNVDSITGGHKPDVTVTMGSATGSSSKTYNESTRYTAEISRDKSNANYIDPSAKFKLTAIDYRANGTISKYTFVKQ